MEKLKFKLPSWEKGEEFIQLLAKETGSSIQIKDAKQVIETQGSKITFHPDDRGFAYITCKIANNELLEIIKDLNNKYF